MKMILVIEDTLAMRENITEILQLASYEVMQAATGKQGIELARQTRPDLILCDIMMPDLDGFGVLHILGKDPILTDVPFVFLTAKADMADFRFGMNLGADDYLTKPFDDLTLLNTVELRLRKGERGLPDTPLNPVGLDNLRRTILNQEDTHKSLCENYPTTQFNRKHRLFTTDNLPTTLYFISRGKVKLFRTDAAGNEYITALCGAGDFVGYLPLLEETTYAETAELLDDAVVCTIPKADFLSLIYHDQEVANQFIRILVGDVAEHQERLLKLAYQSVRKRVAEALLMYQRKFYHQSEGRTPDGRTPDGRTPDGRTPDRVVPPKDTPDDSAIPAPLEIAAKTSDTVVINTSPAMSLSRENWSHLVGASTETVIRILSDLRAEGLISINGSEITLLDVNKLTHLKR